MNPTRGQFFETVGLTQGYAKFLTNFFFLSRNKSGFYKVLRKSLSKEIQLRKPEMAAQVNL